MELDTRAALKMDCRGCGSHTTIDIGMSSRVFNETHAPLMSVPTPFMFTCSQCSANNIIFSDKRYVVSDELRSKLALSNLFHTAGHVLDVDPNSRYTLTIRNSAPEGITDEKISKLSEFLDSVGDVSEVYRGE